MLTKKFPQKYIINLLIVLILIVVAMSFVILYPAENIPSKETQTPLLQDQQIESQKNYEALNKEQLRQASEKAAKANPLTEDQLEQASKKAENPTPLTLEQLNQAFQKN